MTRTQSQIALAISALSGFLFGAGLYISQMVDPLKVLRFLDVGAIPRGGWDPSLALVIAPAIAIMFVTYRFARRQDRPLFGDTFNVSHLKQIDGKLLLGSGMFGVGWGLSGICPGPALSLLAFMPQNLLFFVGALVAGSFAGGLINPHLSNMTGLVRLRR